MLTKKKQSNFTLSFNRTKKSITKKINKQLKTVTLANDKIWIVENIPNMKEIDLTLNIIAMTYKNSYENRKYNIKFN